MGTVRGYKNAQGKFIPTPNKYRPNAHTHPNDREYEQIQIATRTSPNTIKYGLRYVEPVDFSLNATKRRVEASDRFFEPKMNPDKMNQYLSQFKTKEGKDNAIRAMSKMYGLD